MGTPKKQESGTAWKRGTDEKFGALDEKLHF
jgi:hypothetical protein